MEKVRYMISDASSLIQVESHVLRYWEEELELEVPRNEMGHRYYTEENIRQFEQIKKLKDEGYQLKAIKMLIHNQGQDEGACALPEVHNGKNETVLADSDLSRPEASDGTSLSKLEQFQIMMTQIVRRAIAENNEALGEEVSTQVGEKVIKEMNYLMREREEQEEERYRKLDETIRSHQRRPRKEKVRKADKKKDKPKKVRLRAGESVS